MNILDKIKNGFLLFDGAMGTMLIKGGLKPGEIPENLCITDPERIIGIHRAYLDAGCDVVSANTFGANPFKFDNYEQIIKAALDCANEAVCLAKAEDDGRDCFVALDIGSTGEMLKPAGKLEFEDAVSAFAKVINAGKNGADVVLHDAFVTDAFLEIKEESFFKAHSSKSGFAANLIRNSFVGCCMAMTKEVADMCLPFPDGLPMHDWWIALLALKRRKKVVLLPERLIYWRRHENTVTGKKNSLAQQLKWRAKMIILLIERK